MSQPDWRSFKTFSPRHMASFNWPKCLNFQGDTCLQSIGLLMSLLTRAYVLPMSLLTRVINFCMFFYTFISMTLGKSLLVSK